LWTNLPSALKSKARKVIIVVLFPGNEALKVTLHEGMPIFSLGVSTISDEVYPDSSCLQNGITRQSILQEISQSKITTSNTPSTADINSMTRATNHKNLPIPTAIFGTVQMNRDDIKRQITEVIPEVNMIEQSDLRISEGKNIIILDISLIDRNLPHFSYTIRTTKFPHAKDVKVTGDWCDWKQSVPLYRTSSGAFEGHLSFRMLSTYQYKFLVDGYWKFDEDQRIIQSGDNSNNILTCKVPQSLALIATTSHERLPDERSIETFNDQGIFFLCSFSYNHFNPNLKQLGKVKEYLKL